MISYSRSLRSLKSASFVRRSAFSILGNDLLLRRRLKSIEKAAAITVLNLHRVAPDDGSHYAPLDPDLFEKTLIYIKSHFFLTTFSDIYAPKIDSSKPNLILSFDDGYKDFFSHAMPIMRRHRVRANLNVIPKCIETGRPPLNVMAQDFTGKAPLDLVRKLDIPGFAEDPSTPRGSFQLSLFIRGKSQADQLELSDVLLPQFYDWKAFQPTPMMMVDDVRQASLEGHEIGAHSFSHASMLRETDEYLSEDLANCRKYFEDVLKLPMQVYALPNGEYRSNHLDIISRAGVRNTLLVEEDFWYDSHLPCKRFTFDAKSMAEAKFKALGGTRRP